MNPTGLSKQHSPALITSTVCFPEQLHIWKWSEGFCFFSQRLKVLPRGGGRLCSIWAALGWFVLVSRKLRATSRLLLLSSRACLAASRLKPISMMSLKERSSTLRRQQQQHETAERNLMNLRVIRKCIKIRDKRTDVVNKAQKHSALQSKTKQSQRGSHRCLRQPSIHLLPEKACTLLQRNNGI